MDCILIILLQVGLSRAQRLAQGHHIKIEITTPMPIQVDGEPWSQEPCTIEVSHHAQVRLSPLFAHLTVSSPANTPVSLPKAFMLKRVSEEPISHAASIMADILENAENSGTISASQKSALLQDIASRLL